MNDAKIKAIIKRPDEKTGHVANISTSLENLQKTVEGNIETVVVGENPKVIMICNEEGKIRNLQQNFRIDGEIFFGFIRGTVIICGESEDGEDFADVPIDIETWRQYLKAWGNEIQGKERDTWDFYRKSTGS